MKNTVTVEDLKRAGTWRLEHYAHVSRLRSVANILCPPSGSDILCPELWKSEHWKWFDAFLEKFESLSEMEKRLMLELLNYDEKGLY